MLGSGKISTPTFDKDPKRADAKRHLQQKSAVLLRGRGELLQMSFLFAGYGAGYG